MFNVGGGELMVILLVALLVLGPTKLPTAARQVGKVMSDFRNMSAGFQREMRAAMHDPVEAATRDRTPGSDPPSEASESLGSGTANPEVSTAQEAGMYDVAGPTEAEQSDEDQS